jgi:hypothetical protein
MAAIVASKNSQEANGVGGQTRAREKVLTVAEGGAQDDKKDDKWGGCRNKIVLTREPIEDGLL